METNNLQELIQNYHSGNTYALELIIKKMKPLIIHYAKKLYFFEYEDATQEIILTIIKASQQIEDYSNEQKCLSYLKNSVYNRYLELLRQYYNKNTYIFDCPEILENIPNKHFENSLQFFYMKQIVENAPELSETKKMIFNELLHGLTNLEIAAKMNVSRQYVHKVKKQLKELFSKN